MHTYWIILILTLISTLIPIPDVPIYKFKYQGMFDHYVNHHLYDHCANLIMMQILYSYHIVPTCISILTKINILILY